MRSHLDITLLIICVIESIIGVLTNVFIIALNILELVRSRPRNACHLILVTLGLSNVCFQCFLCADINLSSLAPHFYYNGDIFRIFTTICYLTLTSSSWITALLCAFYSLKIVNINQPLFIQLKLRFSILLPWLLMASTFISLFLALPAYWDSTAVYDNSTAEYDTQWSISYIVVIVAFGATLPLLLVVLSITLILMSLYKHIKQMKLNAFDFSQPQLEALSGASRAMICLMVLNICFHLSNMLYMLTIKDIPDICYTLCTIMLVSYCPAQSFIIILGNSKLKQVSKRIICYACGD